MFSRSYFGILTSQSVGITERTDGFIEAEDPQIWFSKYDEWLDVEKKPWNM